jgi:hypothetical protein
MAKVYVTQETDKDFTKAEQFGAVVFLSVDRRDDFNNVHPSEHNERLVSHIKHGLRDFDPEFDWLVPTGSPYISAVVFALLGKSVSRLRILRWDNRDFMYRPLVVDLPRVLNFN